MPNYNSNLQAKNTSLQAILKAVNELPNASGGAELPELTNEGVSANLLVGKELIDGYGNVIVGTMPDNSDMEVVTLDTNTTCYDIPAGYYDGGQTVNIAIEEKIVTPTSTKQIITPSAGRVLSKVTVEAASGGDESGCSITTKTVTVQVTDAIGMTQLGVTRLVDGNIVTEAISGGMLTHTFTDAVSGSQLSFQIHSSLAQSPSVTVTNAAPKASINNSGYRYYIYQVN